MFNKIRSFFSVLTLPEAVALGLGALVVLALFGWGVHSFSNAISRHKFEKARAERLKKEQDALALAEKATESAKAKETQAELLGEQNGQKAKNVQVQTAQIDQQEATAQHEISDKYSKDQAYIDSPLSDCERIRDICNRRARLNPAWACDTSAIAEVCSPDQ